MFLKFNEFQGKYISKSWKAAKWYWLTIKIGDIWIMKGIINLLK